MKRLLNTVVIISWLSLLGTAYSALFLFPAPTDAYSQTPPPPDLSAAYLPLLAALLIPGIIRRLKPFRRTGTGDGDR
jgi:hypothetical protein